MAYTLTRGAARQPTLYTLKNGLDKRIVERVTKKSFWVLPLLVGVLLGLAALTSNQWMGRSSEKGGTPAEHSVVTTSHKNTNNGTNTTSGTKESLTSPSAPSSLSAHNATSSSTLTASSLQKVAPVPNATGILGGKGGDAAGTTAPSVTQPVTDVIKPVTSPPPTSPLPDTSPVTDPITVTPLPPVKTEPQTDPLLGCTPDILGVLPATCL